MPACGSAQKQEPALTADYYVWCQLQPEALRLSLACMGKLGGQAAVRWDLGGALGAAPSG